MSTFAIIIPCYNEEKRLDKVAFTLFANLHPDVQLFFVNDGSNDNTSKALKEVVSQGNNIVLIDLCKNQGKGEAVRQGMLRACNLSSFAYIGYLDADLSTSLEEYYQLCLCAHKKNLDFIFASRIKKLGSVINRSFLRHIVGRMIVTLLDKKFKLGYYDTQCGAKLFKANILDDIIKKPFSTQWFFDIELFLRLRSRDNYVGLEYPLRAWKNVKGSKLSLGSFPSVCREIIVLLSKY